jgi:hypothetical protein
VNRSSQKKKPIAKEKIEGSSTTEKKKIHKLKNPGKTKLKKYFRN